MGKTTNLQLNTFPSSEWGTKKYGEFIKELAGSEASSNMQILDKAVGDLQADMSSKADLVDGLVPMEQLPEAVKDRRIVATIAERDAIPAPFRNLSVYVQDATGDPTVESGGADYIYDGTQWLQSGSPTQLPDGLVVAEDSVDTVEVPDAPFDADTLQSHPASDFLLKSESVDAATLQGHPASDFVTPAQMTAAIQSTVQASWEASY